MSSVVGQSGTLSIPGFMFKPPQRPGHIDTAKWTVNELQYSMVNNQPMIPGGTFLITSSSFLMFKLA